MWGVFSHIFIFWKKCEEWPHFTEPSQYDHQIIWIQCSICRGSLKKIRQKGKFGTPGLMKEESANPPEPDSAPAKSGRQIISWRRSIAQIPKGSQTRSNHTKELAHLSSQYLCWLAKSDGIWDHSCTLLKNKHLAFTEPPENRQLSLSPSPWKHGVPKFGSLEKEGLIWKVEATP